LPARSEVRAAVYATLVGGAVGVAPGTQAGYALTAPSPMSYELRWTGDYFTTGDGYKEFYGSVWTTGHFASITPGCLDEACPLEAGDFVSNAYPVPGGERIDWDTFALDGWDGLSFTTDTEPVVFEVAVDGVRRPDLFFFPSATNDGTVLSPASTPFGMRSSD
jgi:hypothetical protein